MSPPGATLSNFGARLFLAGALLGFAGLPSPAARAASYKQPINTVDIAELGHRVNVVLKVGDTLRVTLPANPSTGYGWQVAENSSAMLLESGSRNLSAAQPKPGAAGKQSFSFTAHAPGKDRVVLNYRRPWEKNAKPARSYAVEVTIGSAAAAVTPVGTLLGTYGGDLPCADCSGIHSTIAFYATGAQQLTNTYYVRMTTYVGAPTGDVVSIDAGNWLVKRGTPGDANATVYSLQSNGSGNSENYLLRGEALVPLRSDGKPIQSPFNMDLKKLP